MTDHSFGADRKEKFLAIQVEYNDRNKEIGDWHDIEVHVHDLPILYLLFTVTRLRIQGYTAFDFPGRNNKVCFQFRVNSPAAFTPTLTLPGISAVQQPEMELQPLHRRRLRRSPRSECYLPHPR
jgi:hypothetical protein